MAAAKKPAASAATPKKPAAAKAPATKPAAKAPGTKRAVKRSSSRKVDWEKALQWYMDDATRSFADVAKQFGVALNTVKRRSIGDDIPWPERRRNVAEANTAQYESSKQKELNKTNEHHRKLYQAMQNAGSRALAVLTPGLDPGTGKTKKGATVDARGLQAAANTIKAGIEGERVILGLPILISKSENAITDVTPPTIPKAEATLDKLEARRKRINELRARRNRPGSA